ncbi:hypothetical protein AQUSIP_23330 [Aquicella siphonis]|uniref:DUF975 family protein n=1 Tax=Aquicella siphonis TaxID=254247 RepID=A0A5E4PL99_9COXI|nr:hypothetical protein [Aquicella siphonis]VVC77006.1 hypothetical protein AQUSIP_23330 [Aquicella siphonis]
MNDLANNLNASPRINIKAVIKEAWGLVYGMKWPVFWIGVLLPFAYFILLFIAMLILVPGKQYMSLPFLLISGCISLLVIWCFLAIIVMLGVRQAIGLSVDVNVVYTHCMEVKDKLVYLALIWLSLTGSYFFIKFMIGQNPVLNILLYAFFLYLKLPLIIFGIPLVVTQRGDMAMTLEESYKAMNRHWPQILACFLIMIGILTVSALPFGIGLIWTMPMYYAMTGILFRDIYGLKRRKQRQEQPGG